MIAHLRGRVLSRLPNVAVLECAGVGYEVQISIETFGALPEVGGEAALHIYTHVREDQIALFGFAEVREKLLFERLLTISGIGPKLAITILSGTSSDRLIVAIRGQDHAALTKIPGVGKKTAERVVLELKDKLDELAVVFQSEPPAAGSGTRLDAVGEDAVSALVNLGYQRAAAQRAVEQAMEREPEARREFETLFRAAMTAMR